MTVLEKEWYIEVPWGKLAIFAWGDCYDPPVLLCHGGTDSAVSYRPLVSRLPQKFYYIGIDLPGNGKSDRFLPGLMISVYDMVFAVHAVVKHFRWKTFTYIGHSFGTYLGKMYNISYPGRIDKLVELDPINLFAIEAEEFKRWYHTFYTDFYKNYNKYNTPKGNAPKIKWETALQSLMNHRTGVNREMAIAILDRLTEPAGDGYVRYTTDLRIMKINGPAYSSEHVRNLFTSVKTQILTVVTTESLKNELFRNTTFLLDEASFPAGNMRCRTVEGSHDVHVGNPEKVAPYIAQFLTNGLKSLDNLAKL